MRINRGTNGVAFGAGIVGESPIQRLKDGLRTRVAASLGVAPGDDLVGQGLAGMDYEVKAWLSSPEGRAFCGAPDAAPSSDLVFQLHEAVRRLKQRPTSTRQTRPWV